MQWEYRFDPLDLSDSATALEAQSDLSDLGESGWQLVGLLRNLEWLSSGSVLAVLKRCKAGEEGVTLLDEKLEEVAELLGKGDLTPPLTWLSDKATAMEALMEEALQLLRDIAANTEP